MSAIDELPHLTEEEGEIERADVRPIHIGVGHNDDSVVAKLVWVELVFPDAAAKSRYQVADFGGAQHFVEARLFHIQNLPFERQDRLELSIPPLLG